MEKAFELTNFLVENKIPHSASIKSNEAKIDVMWYGNKYNVEIDRSSERLYKDGALMVININGDDFTEKVCEFLNEEAPLPVISYDKVK